MSSSVKTRSFGSLNGDEHTSATKLEGLAGSNESQNETASPRSDSPARNLKPLSWSFVVFSLLAALFLFALDNTIVSDVQPNIIDTLGGIEKLPWISVAFALGAVATNLLWYAPNSNPPLTTS
jgi:hypothetical protein